MKIAVYKDSLSTGRGADRAVRNFAAGLSERGHDVTLMERAEFLEKIIGGGKRSDIGGEHRFDVLVATGSNEMVDLDRAGYFDRADRAKVILQLHLAPRGFFKWRHPLRNRRIRKAFDRADAVQVLCSSYVGEFRKLAPHPPVTVIGNYADIETAGANGKESREAFQTILYPAAALNRIKNQMLLIESFASLAAEFPDWKVRLLGKDSTPYAAQCRRMIAETGLDGRVEIVGFTDNLAWEYSRAAFIAFPSILEGFPLAILESARFSLPVVAQADLPGAGDIITSDTGIVTAANPMAYAEGLRRLMEDAALRCQLGEASRIRCENLFSRNKILGQWENLLENMVK